MTIDKTYGQDLRYDKSTLIKQFVAKCAILSAAWLALYYGLILPDGRVNSMLTQLILEQTAWCLDLMGYDIIGSGIDNIVYADGQAVLSVGDACNGLELFVIYAGFIVCFPGKIKFKSIFIPLGILLIFIINVLREVALALNYKYFQQTFDFNHEYTYTIVVYSFIFFVWRFWLNKYSFLSK